MQPKPLAGLYLVDWGSGAKGGRYGIICASTMDEAIYSLDSQLADPSDCRLKALNCEEDSYNHFYCDLIDPDKSFGNAWNDFDDERASQEDDDCYSPWVSVSDYFQLSEDEKSML